MNSQDPHDAYAPPKAESRGRGGQAPAPRQPNYLLALVGAIAGGVVGYLVFMFMVKSGYYAMVVPGALVGLGCGLLSRGHSWVLAVVSAVLGLGLSLFVEWQFFPFVADDSLGFFLANVMDLDRATWLMMGAGALVAFWFGRGRK